MTTSELVFIPKTGAGHLPPAMEFANLLLHRDHRLSITIIIMNQPNQKTQTPSDTNRLHFVNTPAGDDLTMPLISPTNFLTDFIEYQKPHVRKIVKHITESSDSVRLVGFVLDMFCAAMADVANEFGALTYIYFTCGASFLGLMFYLQSKHDDDDFELKPEWKGSEMEFSIPSYANAVPAKVVPSILFNKEGFKTLTDLARKFRFTHGILVNTFHELETHAFEYLSDSNTRIPPVFPVGPMLNIKNTTNDDKTGEIMSWLDNQPDSSVVFLCFGSMGSFSVEQLAEMAGAIEQSGHRFLWSIRQPPSKEEMGFPTEFENPAEALPEGFVERTSSVGKVIGWAPQTAVLSHPSVGGFVSHCGWNSALESIWFGVPVGAWPLYNEQQLNAFKMVVEVGIGAEIKMDYRSSLHRLPEKEVMVAAEEIEGGIRSLMGDGEMRKKMKEMKEKSRIAASEGGSSYESIGRFIDQVLFRQPVIFSDDERHSSSI